MTSYRKTAIIAGVLLIACTAATILSITFLGPILDAPDFLTKLTENETRVIIGAIIEFIWAATAMGIAICLYPILKKYNETLALGSVSFRIVESIFVFVAMLSLLSLLTMSQEFVRAGTSDLASLQTIGTLLLAIRDWAHNGIVLIAFCLGALLYYYVFYQSKFIPRWLSGWGLLGIVMSLAVTLYSLFKPSFVLSWVHTLFNAPIALQEMVLAIWLIVKGFNPSVTTFQSSKTNLNGT